MATAGVGMSQKSEIKPQVCKLWNETSYISAFWVNYSVSLPIFPVDELLLGAKHRHFTVTIATSLTITVVENGMAFQRSRICLSFSGTDPWPL